MILGEASSLFFVTSAQFRRCNTYGRNHYGGAATHPSPFVRWQVGARESPENASSFDDGIDSFQLNAPAIFSRQDMFDHVYCRPSTIEHENSLINDNIAKLPKGLERVEPTEYVRKRKGKGIGKGKEKGTDSEDAANDSDSNDDDSDGDDPEEVEEEEEEEEEYESIDKFRFKIDANALRKAINSKSALNVRQQLSTGSKVSSYSDTDSGDDDQDDGEGNEFVFDAALLEKLSTAQVVDDGEKTVLRLELDYDEFEALLQQQQQQQQHNKENDDDVADGSTVTTTVHEPLYSSTARYSSTSNTRSTSSRRGRAAVRSDNGDDDDDDSTGDDDNNSRPPGTAYSSEKMARAEQFIGRNSNNNQQTHVAAAAVDDTAFSDSTPSSGSSSSSSSSRRATPQRPSKDSGNRKTAAAVEVEDDDDDGHTDTIGSSSSSSPPPSASSSSSSSISSSGFDDHDDSNSDTSSNYQAPFPLSWRPRTLYTNDFNGISTSQSSSDSRQGKCSSSLVSCWKGLTSLLLREKGLKSQRQEGRLQAAWSKILQQNQRQHLQLQLNRNNLGAVVGGGPQSHTQHTQANMQGVQKPKQNPNWWVADLVRRSLSETLVGTAIIGVALTAAVLGMEVAAIGVVNWATKLYDLLVVKVLPGFLLKYRRRWEECGKPTLLIVLLLIRIGEYIVKWRKDRRFDGIGYRVVEKY